MNTNLSTTDLEYYKTSFSDASKIIDYLLEVQQSENYVGSLLQDILKNGFINKPNVEAKCETFWKYSKKYTFTLTAITLISSLFIFTPAVAKLIMGITFGKNVSNLMSLNGLHL